MRSGRAKERLDAGRIAGLGRGGLMGRAAAWRWVMVASLAALVVSAAWGQGLGGGSGGGAGGGAGGGLAVPAARSAKNVAVIPIRGELDERGHLARSVERRVEVALRARAQAIVFELDVPGGSGGATRISELIRGLPITNTVAWVHPRARGGGALIALACREIVVGESAEMGDATPEPPTQSLRALVGRPRNYQALVPTAIDDAVSSARFHNDAAGDYVRDEDLSRAMVQNDTDLWLVRETATGRLMCVRAGELVVLFPGAGMPQVVLGAVPPTFFGSGSVGGAGSGGGVTSTVASRRPVVTGSMAGQWELVGKVPTTQPLVLAGAELATFGLVSNAMQLVGGQAQVVPIRSDEDIRSFFGASHVRRLERTWSEGLVLFLTSFWVRAALIVVFLVALFVEMTHPGAVVPGAVALVALGLFIAPPMLIGLADVWEVLAVVAGVLLIALEIFVLPGFGVPGIVGLVLLGGGLIATFVPEGALFPDSPQERSDLLYAVSAVVLAGVTSAGGMFMLARYLAQVPILGKLVLRDPGSEEDEDGSVEPLSAMGEVSDGAVRVGDVGVAITPMRPAGRVQVGDRLLDAVAETGFIRSGEGVRVSSVSGMRVGVERVEGIGGPGGSGTA